MNVALQEGHCNESDTEELEVQDCGVVCKLVEVERLSERCIGTRGLPLFDMSKSGSGDCAAFDSIGAQ